ncbi:unnamed protein product [Amoebophrya sp. A25]|nr:unnamed protein product [Amoebophrya sp. A25]|eukprot:GSA25T00015917001.1
MMFMVFPSPFPYSSRLTVNGTKFLSARASSTSSSDSFSRRKYDAARDASACGNSKCQLGDTL